MADFTKPVRTLMQTNEWELLDDTGGTPFYESTVKTLPDEIGAIVFVDICHLDANAVAVGSEAEIVVWIRSHTDDDDWHELPGGRVGVTGGQAAGQALDQESAAAQANVYIATTSGFDVPAKKYFLNDNSNIENSEIVVCKKAVTDDYLIAVTNLKHTFAIADDILNIVNQFVFRIPKEVKAFKVTGHTHDADATFAVRTVCNLVSDIE